MNEFGKFSHHATFPYLIAFPYLIHLQFGWGIYSLPFDSILHIPSSHLPLTNMSLPKYTLLQFASIFDMIHKHEEKAP